MTEYFTDDTEWQELAGYSRAVRRGHVVTVSGASWEQAARAHRDVLGAVRPANTMLYVGGLIGDGFLVEIEALAVVVP